MRPKWSRIEFGYHPFIKQKLGKGQIRFSDSTQARNPKDCIAQPSPLDLYCDRSSHNHLCRPALLEARQHDTKCTLNLMPHLVKVTLEKYILAQQSICPFFVL